MRFGAGRLNARPFPDLKSSFFYSLLQRHSEPTKQLPPLHLHLLLSFASRSERLGYLLPAMESPEIVHPVEFDDGKYVSGLSAILVSSIQEAKDKICQIEYIFCNQIYPNFQSKQKTLRKIYSEAKKAAEDSWMEKENELRLQVEKLQAEKGTMLREYEEKMDETLEQLRCKEAKAQQLERDLLMKIKEADEGLAMQKDLIQTIKKNTEAISSKNIKLYENEKKTNVLLADLRTMEKNVEVLQKELREKTEEITEGRNLQQELKKQADQLVEREKEKELLLTKVNCLEEKVNELQLKLRESNGTVADEGDVCKQIELKDSELKAERNKFRKVIDAYKRLKSQYNFLLDKNGLTLENTTKLLNQKPSPDNASRTPEAPAVAFEVRRVKDEPMFIDKLDEKGFNSIQTFSPRSPPSNLPIAEGFAKSCASAGTKRRSSGWRETRSRQRPSGLDPHDDFLDTPLDNIRENLNKTLNEGAADDFPDQYDSLDEETQDMNVDPRPEDEQMPDEIGEKREFKYVAPVRKKSERENLKGFECNQCKKFYDAVLDDGSSKQQNIRCEHHQGVSRHRYKYNPPLTPEGFWNIGFESEM